MDPVQDFADKKLTEARERITDKRETRKRHRQLANKEIALPRVGRYRDKTIFQKALKTPELWSEAMKIAELKNPTPDGAPDWLVDQFNLARKKVAKEYLERAIYGTTVREDREAKKLNEDDSQKKGVLNKELDENRLKAIGHNEREIRRLENKPNRSKDEEKILQERNARARIWGEYKDQLPPAEFETTDKEKLGNLNLLKEEGKQSAAFQEIRKRLWQIGLDVAKGEKGKEDVYRDQDKLILDSERQGAEKWKGYIESWAFERKWRGDIRIPYLPKHWTAWWGKAEVAVFDFLTGGWVTRLEKTVLEESKARIIREKPSAALRDYDKKLHPAVVRDMEQPDENLIVLVTAKVGKEYQIVVDVYRHAVLDIKNQSVEQQLSHTFKYSAEDADRLIKSAPGAFELLCREISDLLTAHQDIYLAESGISLTSKEIEKRAQRLAAKVVNQLRASKKKAA